MEWEITFIIAVLSWHRSDMGESDLVWLAPKKLTPVAGGETLDLSVDNPSPTWTV